MLDSYNNFIDDYHFFKHMNDGCIYHGTDRYKGGRGHSRPFSREKVERALGRKKKKAKKQAKKSRRQNRRQN